MTEQPRGFAVGSDDGERLDFAGGAVIIRASTEAFAIWEEVPPLLDTPWHVHAREDEMFHVLEGHHAFQCGDEEWSVGPGGFVFLPRGVPHAHQRLEPGVGRLLVITSPGGFDGFFRLLAAAESEGTLGPETYAEASERFGITWPA